MNNEAAALSDFGGLAVRDLGISCSVVECGIAGLKVMQIDVSKLDGPIGLFMPSHFYVSSICYWREKEQGTPV